VPILSLLPKVACGKLKMLPMAAGSNVIPLHPAATARSLPGDAAAMARALYGTEMLGTGEPALHHAEAVAHLLGELKLDTDAVNAGWLFAVPQYSKTWREQLEPAFGLEVVQLLDGLSRLHKLRDITRSVSANNDTAQTETLRKMLLAMVADVRVVLIRLASRLQTLRYLAKSGDAEQGRSVARESLDFYAPLANRLGVWQFKWELEDLSFRLLEPLRYKQIASLLDARRTEREAWITTTIAQLHGELKAAGVSADIAGRPKHIYSIFSKMRNKEVGFDDLYDVRALRVIVRDVKDCYTALGVVHNLWQPIPKEFDDYISRPKGNNYRSLHTAVIGPQDLALEVQIRTPEMHQHAELGVAAHWRYKEAGVKNASQSVKAGGGFDDKVALLRQLLAWRDEVDRSPADTEDAHGETDNSPATEPQVEPQTEPKAEAQAAGKTGTPTKVAQAPDWRAATGRAKLDDTIYVITPQGRVIDLPQGATPIDFAYSLHSDLGHRCRGARVDGALVPLNTPLATGQRIEIVSAKTGGPSRDWLNPQLGYLVTHRARSKVRQWFNAQELAQTLATGRALVEKELQREGRTATSLEWLAGKLGFASLEDLFAAAAQGDWSVRQIEKAFVEAPPATAEEDFTLAAKKSRSDSAIGKSSGILIVGVDRLMTQLAKCCKPAPPDAIAGFITKGRGVSIHRADCTDLRNLANKAPERVIETQWGTQSGSVFPVDIEIEAHDRAGLLRDVGEVLSREKVNVTATRSQTRQQVARMAFTVEVNDIAALHKALGALREVSGVTRARRA